MANLNESEFPQPIVRKAHWYRIFVWIIPICAAVAAAFYAHDYYEKQGITITIRFPEADGIRVRDTPLLHRGVEIGQVSKVELSENHREAIVQIRLNRHESVFSKKGAIFWIVRPEISNFNLSGLNTVLTGPYIDSVPGTGEAESLFRGLEKAPDFRSVGVKITLTSHDVSHLQSHSPIYYKGIEVGQVEEVELSHDGSQVEAHALIWKGYEPLVKTHSQFWTMSGLDVQGSILSGLDVKMEGLRTLVNGGVDFATPEKNIGDSVKDGASFALNSEYKKDWLKWSPKIAISPGPGHEQNDYPPAFSQHRRLAGHE